MMERRDFNDPAYKRWRKKVFKRDKFKCRMPGCDTGDKRLNAHHIKCWSTYPHLRFVLANGCSLCRTHHALIRGKEKDYEVLLSQIIGASGTDAAMRLMMMRYKNHDEEE